MIYSRIIHRAFSKRLTRAPESVFSYFLHAVFLAFGAGIVFGVRILHAHITILMSTWYSPAGEQRLARISAVLMLALFWVSRLRHTFRLWPASGAAFTRCRHFFLLLACRVSGKSSRLASTTSGRVDLTFPSELQIRRTVACVAAAPCSGTLAVRNPMICGVEAENEEKTPIVEA